MIDVCAMKTSTLDRKRKRLDAFGKKAKDDQVENGVFTVKCGIRRILRDVDDKCMHQASSSKTQEKLRKIVRSASEVTALMTGLINFHVLRLLDANGNVPDISQTTIRRACMFVSGKQPKTDEELRISFQMWSHSVPSTFVWPSSAGLSRLLDQMCLDYLVNCKNHIATNFERFTRRYIRLRITNLLTATNYHLSSKSIGKTVWDVYTSTTRDHTFTCFSETNDVKQTDNAAYARMTTCLQDLVTEIRQSLQPIWPITDISLQKKWSTFLPWFRCVGKAIETERTRLQAEVTVSGLEPKIIASMRRRLRGYRSFSLLPHRKPRAIHIPLTKSTMDSIRNTLGLTCNMDNPFQSIFDFRRLHGKERLFANYIRTDGESASVLFYRNAVDGARLLQEKKEKSEKKTVARAAKRCKVDSSATRTNTGNVSASKDHKDQKHLSTNASKMKDAKIEKMKSQTLPIPAIDVPSGVPIIGLDPGIRYPFVAVGVPCSNNGHRVVRLSNGGFRWMAGSWKIGNERRRLQRKATEKDARLTEYFNTGLLVKTVDTKCTLLRAEHEFKCFHSASSFFNRPQVKKLTLRAYQGRQRALDFACRMVTGRATWENGHPIFGKTANSVSKWRKRQHAQIVAFGDAGFSSCMRGNPPVAIRGFKERLRLHSIVVDVDEYKTSQTCAHCDHPFSNIPTVYGVRVCTNSSAHAGRARTFVDRDSNAAINMRRVFVARQQGIILAPFVRNTSTQRVASAACFI